MKTWPQFKTGDKVRVVAVAGVLDFGSIHVVTEGNHLMRNAFSNTPYEVENICVEGSMYRYFADRFELVASDFWDPSAHRSRHQRLFHKVESGERITESCAALAVLLLINVVQHCQPEFTFGFAKEPETVMIELPRDVAKKCAAANFGGPMVVLTEACREALVED